MSNPIEKARKAVEKISYEHPENPVEAVSKNTFSPYQSFSGNDYYNTSSNTYSAFSTANYLNENTQENEENEEEPDYEPVMNPDLCILCDLPYTTLCKKCNPYIRTCRNNHSWYISQNKQVKTTHNRH